jgi:hypothetical protein
VRVRARAGEFVGGCGHDKSVSVDILLVAMFSGEGRSSVVLIRLGKVSYDKNIGPV